MSDSESGISDTRPKQQSLEEKFSLLLDQMQVMNGNLERLIAGEQQEPDPNADGDPTSDRGEPARQDQNRASAEGESSGNTALLKATAQDLNLKEKTGPAIEGELAEVVNALLNDKMNAEALKAKTDNYARPENIEGICTPQVNPLIWNQICASMRTQDAGSQKNQNSLVASMITMAKAADIVMKKHEGESELLALLTDAISLAIECHHEASHAFGSCLYVSLRPLDWVGRIFFVSLFASVISLISLDKSPKRNSDVPTTVLHTEP